MLVTTFLAKHDTCDDGKAFALKYNTMEQVWKNCNRSDWMLWILERTRPMPDTMARKFACWCVRNTPLADGRTTWDLLTDERSRNAVVVAEQHAAGKATDEQLAAARAAAWAAWDARAAAWAAWGARDAAWDAARAAWAASAAAWAASADRAAAAWDAARAAAWAAASAAAWAAGAWDAARAASAAASVAAKDAQCRGIRRLIPSLTKWTAKPKKAKRKDMKCS